MKLKELDEYLKETLKYGYSVIIRDGLALIEVNSAKMISKLDFQKIREFLEIEVQFKVK